MMRIALGIIAAMVSAAALAGAGEKPVSRVAQPAFKIENGEACVEPAAQMRRNHMKMLLHQRDLTVHQGLREARYSLKNCVNCHASRKTGSVLGKDGFCSSCHEYASVSIDCFECHSSMRQVRAAAAR
jgi:hypothetical protein